MRFVLAIPELPTPLAVITVVFKCACGSTGAIHLTYESCPAIRINEEKRVEQVFYVLKTFGKLQRHNNI
jgi:hypothetical protein